MVVDDLIGWEDMASLWDSFERLEKRMMQRATSFRTASVRVPLDIYETDHDVVVVAALPGVDPSDIDIRFERGVLTLRGEFKPPLGNVEYWLQEIPYGTFARSVAIKVPVQEDEIGATFEQGILTISLPKTDQARRRTIRVRSG